MNKELVKTLSDNKALGQKCAYPKLYDRDLLYQVSRSRQREAMGFAASWPFYGYDIWNCYELSWLNMRGKPQRVLATFSIDCRSEFLAESKSVKLYLNSINNQKFAHEGEVIELIAKDLSSICQSQVRVEFSPLELKSFFEPSSSGFYVLDELDIDINNYQKNIDLLAVKTAEIIQEKVVSHLFKSHCLCTGQPDWGSIFIEYEGPKIVRESLLAYLISFHDHVGFSENCVEQIFVDIAKIAKPKSLTVYGRFTRRGGIDINPCRSTLNKEPANSRLLFQ